jgi:DtxR family Mn-dependent transcriptional regulator
MRKHRLAERLLTDVIGLDLAHVHEEACRWEHVISDLVEERLLALLNAPERSPYGNRIPGLKEVGVGAGHASQSTKEVSIELAVATGTETGRLIRIGEPAQSAPGVLDQMVAASLVPGASIRISSSTDGISLDAGAGVVVVYCIVARHVFIEPT